MTTPSITLTREQLHEMVWTEPVRTIAKRFGISDRGLAKMCIRMHVPLPARGHWQKKAVGRESRRVPLRPLLATATTGEREVVIRGGLESTRPRSDAVLAEEALERKPERAIQVPPTLDNAHPLVERTARSLRRARADQRGILVPEAKLVLDVRVTRASLDRALPILAALVPALEERGYPVKCVADPGRRTSVRVSDEEIGFRLEERIRRVDRPEYERWKSNPRRFLLTPPLQYEYIATGDLLLHLTDEDFGNSRRTWRDTQRQRLETALNRFIVGLVQTAEAKKIERKRQEELHLEWEERRRLEAQAQLLRMKQERKIRLLEEDIAARAHSQRIREYVQAARAAADSAIPENGRARLVEWLDWAAAYADQLDPVLRGTPPRDPWESASSDL